MIVQFDGRTIAEVDAKLRQYHAQQESGIVIDDSQITLKQWAEKWLKTYCGHLRVNTFSDYKNAIDKPIVPAIGQYRILDIREHHLQELLSEIATSTYGSQNKPYSKGTIQLIKITLQKLFE